MTDPRIEPVRVREVFEVARGLPIGDRRVFLTSTCAGEPGVRDQVDRLLAAHQFARSLPGAALPTVADSNVTTPGDAGRIPGYELLAFIGAGGMGEVYKARDTKLDRPVALKLLPVHLAHSPDRLRRFRAEARAASSLNHPHILVVHDFGDCDGRPFMVTEFVEGQTLRQRIAAGSLPVPEVTR